MTIKHTPEQLCEWFRYENIRFWAEDNISEYIDIEGGQLDEIVDNATAAFEGVLDALLIDRKEDPNSEGTARRLAKMYVHEIMAGRYYPKPDATAFPNVERNAIEDTTGDIIDFADTKKYAGLLVIRAELKSMCSHHHQPVTGVAYIGIIPEDSVLGLSKYVRIAQWCARRGTLQEELTNMIQKEIQESCGTQNVAVHIGAEHGCCTNRGIMATSSLTQTTVLGGVFDEPDVKKEFFDNIALQQRGVGVY